MDIDSQLTGDVIGNIIAKFLEENGGMPNGYDTWVSGQVSMLDHRLSWYTPEAGRDLPVNLFDRKALHLARSIRAQLKDSGYDQVLFEKKHIEHGCFDVRIKLAGDVGCVPFGKIRR